MAAQPALSRNRRGEGFVMQPAAPWAGRRLAALAAALPWRGQAATSRLPHRLALAFATLRGHVARAAALEA